MTAAIAGIGHTTYSRSSGVSDLALATEAIGAALADAGLGFEDVDGLVTYEHDLNDPWYLAGVLGLGDLSWFSRTSYGGGMAGAVVQDAVLAIDAGCASTVVVYRAGNLRSGWRPGQAANFPIDPTLQWTSPFGAVTPAHRIAPILLRYMHERGVTNQEMAAVSLVQRAYAATNPHAHFFERPLSEEEHQATRWVVEPVLRVADCCLETDGGVALVVVDGERAVDLPRPPVYVRAAARAMAAGSQRMSNYYSGTGASLPDMRLVGARLWATSGLRPEDVDVGVFYDAFAPYVPMCLEELGFCEPGGGVDFVRDGQTSPGGRLPVNTNGGQLAEAYIHGFNGIVEAVRQLRGEAPNQVADAVNAMVVGSPAGATSGVVLSAEAGDYVLSRGSSSRTSARWL